MNALMHFVAVILLSAAANGFVARDYFVANSGQAENVRIAYINKDFTVNFLPLIEMSQDRVVLRVYCLDEPAVHEEIMETLSSYNVQSVNLNDIWCLLSAQAQGETGDLSTTRENVFYSVGLSGVLRAIVISWTVSGWHITSYQTGVGYDYPKGTLVFVRKPQ